MFQVIGLASWVTSHGVLLYPASHHVPNPDAEAWRESQCYLRVNSGAQGPAEGLNCAVEVHVEERILVVPDSRRRVSYVVAYKPKQELASSRFTNR